MNKILLLLLIVCINNLVFSQWETQISNTGNSLTDIHFIDDEIGFSCGASGTVLKTNNGGTTWQVLQSNTSNSLKSIYGLDINNIYTGNLSLRKTTNGNSFFEIGGLNMLGGVDEIYFFDNNNGIILNSSGVLKTINGATSWQSTNISPSQNAPLGQLWLNSFQFTGLNIAYAYGGFSSQNYGEIFKTIDGGNNWIDLNVSTSYISTMNFINSNIGYYFSHNTGLSSLYKTIDGGVTWNLINNNVNRYITGLVFIDELTAYSTSLDGYIDKTIDGGVTWTNSYSTNGITLTSIEKTNNNSLFAIGSNGIILKNEELVLSTDNIISANKIRIYPNPSSHFLYIDFENFSNLDVNIQLYNTSGQLILDKNTATGRLILNVEKFPKGIYILRIISKKSIHNEKVIFQ